MTTTHYNYYYYKLQLLLLICLGYVYTNCNFASKEQQQRIILTLAEEGRKGGWGEREGSLIRATYFIEFPEQLVD